MSIEGAVAELDAEISRLTEQIKRITDARTSLLEGSNGSSGVGNKVKRRYRTRVDKTSPAKKTVSAKKGISAKKTAAPNKVTAAKGTAPAAKKRVMSAEAKRRISEANKKRWAKIKNAKATS